METNGLHRAHPLKTRFECGLSVHNTNHPSDKRAPIG